MIDVLIKRGNWDTDILTGESSAEMKAEMRLCFYKRSIPEIAETARSQGTGREQVGSQSPQEEQPCWHPGLRAPASRIVEQEISGVEASQSVGLWYNSFREPAHMCTHTWETLAWLLSPSHCLFLGRAERRGSDEQELLSCNESDCRGVGPRSCTRFPFQNCTPVQECMRAKLLQSCLFFHSVDLVEVCKNKEKGSG